MKKLIALLALGIACAAMAQDAERAFLPPTMGWSSWNTFGANITETTIKKQADIMVSKGYAEAGYKYVNIDDGYFANRDANGRLIIHPARFPNGMKPVVDYIHSKGLKAGCYSDGGHNTCASMWGGETGGEGAGLYEHDLEDCVMYFCEFGFDFIKVDFCGGVNYHNKEHLDLDPKERYTAIRKAIDATGRADVVFNVCRWAFPGTWVMKIADSWRTTGDINASWGSVRDIIKENLYLSAYCGEGHYNDMDMLEVGRGLSNDEDETHFGMWCIMSSPLLIGCDMSSASSRARKLMTNPELIALNQDPLGLQAYVAARDGEAYILVKDIETLNGNTRAVAIYNPSDAQAEVTLDFADIDLGGQVQLRDLAKRADIGTMAGAYTVTLAPHASQFLKATAEERLLRTLYEAETAYLSAYQELENNQWKETATYVENPAMSGGAGAGWLGKTSGNDLQWRNVYVPVAGEYEMSITYCCGEDRSLSVVVNDNKKSKQSFDCNSGSFDKLADITLRVNLNAGNNVVRLFTTGGKWMPDIDCMTLELIEAAASDPVADPQQPQDARVIDLSGRVASPDGDTSSLPAGIYIRQGRKILVK